MSFQNTRKVIGNYSYLLNHSIGDGCSSSVYRAINSQTKQQVSIKVIPKILTTHSDQTEMASVQIESLKILKNCPNILSLKDAIQTKKSIYIITQLCQKGTLSDLIRKQRKLQQSRAIALLQRIINGYRSIHSHNLIHRDIKPSNIFLTLNDQIRIGDFGFVLNASQCEQVFTENIGSPLYMPYESLAENKYSFKSDIWAIGVTFLEMLMGKNPWKAKNQKDLLVELASFQPQMFLAKKFTQRTLTFLKKILQKDIDKRMTPQQLFAFSFSTQFLQTSIRQKIDKAQQLTHQNSSISSTNKSNTFKENKPTINSGLMINKTAKEVTNKKVDHSLANIKKTSINSQAQQRKIMLQIQCQINYFRFMFKLSKKMHQTLKTNDNNIKELQQHLIFLVHQKITQIKHLKYTSFPQNFVNLFQQSQEYQKVTNILQQYKIRYAKEQQKLRIMPTKGTNPLSFLLTYTLKVLYQNIVKIQGEEDELNRKKELIFILQDLIHLQKLLQLNSQSNWQAFLQQSSLWDILEGKTVENINIYWSETKKRVKSLIGK